MQRWEYKVIEIGWNPGNDTKYLESKLKPQGENGWELVQVVFDAGGLPMLAVFKRPM